MTDLNWIVVRTPELWPCAIVRSGDVPSCCGSTSAHAVERIEAILDKHMSVDEIHNTLDEHGIYFEPIDDVATPR